MNTSQRRLLRVMAAAIALMVLFPPWQIVVEQRVLATGYAFLLDLPTRSTSLASNVDVMTLAAQIAGVLIVGGLVFLSLKDDS